MRSAVWISLCLGVSGLSATSQTVPTINACVNNLNGTTRVVAPTASCINGLETAKQWNVTGPQGVQGTVGAVGRSGPIGSAGPTGAQGSQGGQGGQGVAGPSGPTGPQGAVGSQGASGVTLAHIVIIPASGTPAQNGQALFDAVAVNSGRILVSGGLLDSRGNPGSDPGAPLTLIQLDAGFYVLPGPLNLPVYVYLRGVGIELTHLSAAAGDSVIETGTGTNQNSWTGLAQLTIQGDVTFERTLHVTLDNVYISGNTLIWLPNTVPNSTTSDTRITNSILQGSLQDNGPLHIIGSQVKKIFAIASFTPIERGCFATYDLNNVPYPTTCY
jgi:hypothetical protein